MCALMSSTPSMVRPRDETARRPSGAHIWSMWRRRWSARQNTAMTVYWVSIYQEIRDEQKMAAYAALAGPALTSAGGRVIARDLPEKVYEGGLNQRVVIIEFDSLEAATKSGSTPGCRRRHSAWSPDID